MAEMTQQVEQIIDYIMKKCLWQFHSRAWDRERQNKEVLAKTCEVLCAWWKPGGSASTGSTP